GWLPPDFCASRSCLTLGTDIPAEAAALNALEGSPPGAEPPDISTHDPILSPARLLRGRDLLRDGPDEAGQFAGDRCGHLRLRLATCDEALEAASQSQLGFPREVT